LPVQVNQVSQTSFNDRPLGPWASRLECLSHQVVVENEVRAHAHDAAKSCVPVNPNTAKNGLAK
jgi:hypothetical protein